MKFLPGWPSCFAWLVGCRRPRQPRTSCSSARAPHSPGTQPAATRHITVHQVQAQLLNGALLTTWGSGFSHTWRMLVGVLLGSFCTDISCSVSRSSRVRVTSDPTEWKQPFVEPSFISCSVEKTESGHVCSRACYQIQRYKGHGNMVTCHLPVIGRSLRSNSAGSGLVSMACVVYQSLRSAGSIQVSGRITAQVVHKDWKLAVVRKKLQHTIASSKSTSSIFFISRSFLLLASE